MTTAQEIQVKLNAALPILNDVSRVIAETISVSAMLRVAGREVCASRAKMLRKRGETVRWVGTTKNGKSRYRWMPKMDWRVTPNEPRSPAAKQSGGARG